MPSLAPAASRLVRWLPAALGHAAIAVVASWPLVLSPFSRMVGHPDVDVWNHAWGPWWFWTALSSGRLPYRTDLLMAPRGGVLWFIDPVGGLLGAPLIPVLGVTATWNLLILVALGLASLAARRLARELGASDGASWIASLALACSPYLVSEVHNGISEAVGVAWPLLALAAGHRTLGGRWRDAVVAGLWLGFSAFASYYYAMAAGLVLAAWTLAVPGPRLPRLGRMAVVAGVGLALAVPTFLAIQASIASPDAIIARAPLPLASAEYLLTHNAVDPRTFFAPGDFQSTDLAAAGEAFRHSSYLGLVALALALWSRRWGVWAGIAVAVAFGLGPFLWWGDGWVTVGQARLALPSRLFLHLAPVLSGTHFQRLGMPAVALVAALAAVTASRWSWRAWIPLGLAVVVDGLIVGPSPWPLARTPALDVAAHEAIAGRPVENDRGTTVSSVLDLPVEVGSTMATSRYLVYQAASGRPVPNRPDPRFDTSSLANLQPFQLLSAWSVGREPHRSGLRKRLEDVTGVDPGQLRRAGVQWIVLHRELDPCPAATERQLRAWYGEPEVFGDHQVWSTAALVPRYQSFPPGDCLEGP